MVVIPNVMGVCSWSPRLDKLNNSCRGIQFFEVSADKNVNVDFFMTLFDLSDLNCTDYQYLNETFQQNIKYFYF